MRGPHSGEVGLADRRDVHKGTYWLWPMSLCVEWRAGAWSCMFDAERRP